MLRIERYLAVLDQSCAKQIDNAAALGQPGRRERHDGAGRFGVRADQGTAQAQNRFIPP